MQSQRSRFSKGERKLYILSISFLVIAFGAVFWWRDINADPVVTIPTSTPPSPNAWDFYVKAEKVHVKAITGTGIDPMYDAKSQPVPANDDEYNKRYPLPAKDAWLKRNALSLSLLRQGFGYHCEHPPPQVSSLAFGYYAGFREMGRDLVVESHGYKQRKTWDKSLDSSLDAIKLGADITHGAALMGHLVGGAIEALGSKAAWDVLPRQSALSSRAGARRLETILADAPTYADIVQEQKWGDQSLLLQLFHDARWRGSTFVPDDAPPREKASAWLKLRIAGKRGMMNELTAIFDARIANAHLPYTAQVREPRSQNPIIEQMTNDYSGRWSFARTQTADTLLMMALALRAYQLEHGRYPATLNELVPDYLKQIPVDPYGGSEPLRYRSDGKAYTLWSIGPDGIDDGGRAILDKSVRKETPRSRYVMPDSKGDIVAGINGW